MDTEHLDFNNQNIVKSAAVHLRRTKADERIVVKIGTGVLMTPDKKIDHAVIARIAQELSELYQKGFELVVISSGAVGSGREVMRFSENANGSAPEGENGHFRLQGLGDRLQKKLLAAIGQARLMQFYRESFDPFKIPIAQLLLLREDFHDRERYLSIRTILEQLVAHRVIPILNENDPLAPADLCFSDNDNLAALVAVALKADHLVILSDTPGLYDKPPYPPSQGGRKSPPEKGEVGGLPQLIPVVREITPEIKSYCSESVSGVGVGGMINKIMAIEMATRAGIAAHLVYGQRPGALLDCLSGKNPGTYFMAQPKKSKSAYLGQKSWLAGGVVPSGAIVVDAGALGALKNHKSLLAVGIKSIVGTFRQGDVVSIFDEANVPHGTGKVRYGSSRLAKLETAGTQKVELAKTLFPKPVIHVDEMVVW